MPRRELRHRKQRAVLWGVSGKDSFNEPTFSVPIEIDVRWKFGRREVTGSQGTPMSVDATVIIGQEIVVDSLMWLGTLESWYGLGSSGTDIGMHQVVSYNETPDITGRHLRRSVMLSSYRDRRPLVAE